MSRSSSKRIVPVDTSTDQAEVVETASTVISSHQLINGDPESNLADRKEANSSSNESWLPITQSRKGNVSSCVFHLVSSGIGAQALMLPFASSTLGWAWGIAWFQIGFVWQLYTKWVLIQLHESESGVRYSRFLQLAMLAFGPKLGKWLCMLPVLYLSSAQCTITLISAAHNLRFLYQIMCLGSTSSNCSKPLTTTECFLIFASFALLLLLHPNLDSLTWVSLLGTITTLLLFSLISTASLIAKPRLEDDEDITYDPTYEESVSKLTRSLTTTLAMELTALSFRGHNLILEIQGTLPSRSTYPTHKPMWKALRIAYVLIALCMYPLAFGGYWAYGNKVTREGLVNTFWKFHKDGASTTILGLILIFLVVKQLCEYQIYAMPSVDNYEYRYTLWKKKACSFWIRSLFRVLFVSSNFVAAVVFPFLPALALVTGVFNLSVTFVYPCFMWIAIKKPRMSEPMFWLNLLLGCLGILMCLVFLVSGIWNLSRDGLTAHFFHP